MTKTKNVQALFTAPGSVYLDLLWDDCCWPETRDARRYAGLAPVVAHPPCNLWVNLAAVNWKRYRRQLPAWYPGGTDGGCFAHALHCVRTYGGALEHPAFSHAWAAHGLTPPGEGWTRCGEGWTCEVWQSAYGHQARKRTWIYYCGSKPPFDLDWTRKPGTHQIGWFDRSRPTLSKRDANATPRKFAEVLLKLAQQSNTKRAV